MYVGVEETQFVNGLDLEAYWNRCHHFTPEFSSQHFHEACIANWQVCQVSILCWGDKMLDRLKSVFPSNDG